MFHDMQCSGRPGWAAFAINFAQSFRDFPGSVGQLPEVVRRQKVLDVLALVDASLYAKIYTSTKKKYDSAVKIVHAVSKIFDADAQAAAIVQALSKPAAARVHTLDTDVEPEPQPEHQPSLTGKKQSAKRKRFDVSNSTARATARGNPTVP